MNETLCACGTCFEERGYGQLPFWRWYLYYREFSDKLGVDKFLCCNDGWKNVPLQNEVDLRHAITLDRKPLSNPLTVIYQGDRLGRRGHYAYPGWWRNLGTACRALLGGDFQRFVWIECDAFIISDRMMEQVNETKRGLVAYWCPRHNQPECGIFICDREQARVVLQISSRMERVCLDPRAGTAAEYVLPWTDLRRDMIGDRYGEQNLNYPPEADFACQWTTERCYPRFQ